MIFKNDYEFNMFGIYNYKKPGKLTKLIKFIKENHKTLKGDILESGVFQGSQSLAIAMLLKELGSEKKVYAFDSFSGFPNVYHANDNKDKFQSLYENNIISKDHYENYLNFIKLKKLRSEGNLENTPSSISSSGDFSENSLDSLKSKTKLLKLDNIVFVKGDFEITMNEDNKLSPVLSNGIMSAIIDCDLYESYRVTLNFLSKKLNRGGLVYLDEYYSLKFPGARIATNEAIATSSNFKLELDKREDGDFERWYLSCQ